MDMMSQMMRHDHEITRYGSSGFTVAGVRYDSALLLTSTHISTFESVGAFDLVSIRAIVEPLPQKPEILLLGTGHTHQFIAPSIRHAVKLEYGIALDSMDTGAACRTFNLLLSEGRSVGAILLPY